ncbi:hypothetical protein JTE90_021218 [Oedothorax gibbosus]|uniref:Uncharacterized protein n=1 Tax=Oedothorax gibbosus TaxID=931172 RepID=A0AAV6UXG5_9ARAC|nr:hypothetical protein JTE90_021218 [Oedothorax gibbosus]
MNSTAKVNSAPQEVINLSGRKIVPQIIEKLKIQENRRMSSVSSKEFLRRYRKALSVPFALNLVCSSVVQEFVSASSAALGCSEKCFLLPLLTCAASCLGTEACVELSPNWREPPVLWTLVLCTRSLLRVDVAEHFKQQVLRAQEKALVLGKGEDTKEYLRKFLFDSFTLERLQDTLKLSHGHGLAVYNSVRALHPNLATPEQADVFHRLQEGNAWFTDSRVSRMTLTKTRVNFAVVSTPSAAHRELGSPNFDELFHQCFLVTCAEEVHVKFAQIGTDTEPQEKLQEVFVSLLKLHAGGKGEAPLVYRLGEEAREKLAQVHDELTDKARQMARKNAPHVFAPALAYLLRLALSLHVLDAVLEAINFKVPLSRLTWSTEISADTVWQARELLSHAIAQRHCLMEPTGFEGASSSQKQGPPPVHSLVEGQPLSTPSPHRTPSVTPRSPATQFSPRFSFNNNARRNILNVRSSRVTIPVRPYAAPILPNDANAPISNGGASSSVTPIIASVCSAGVGVSLPSALSVSSLEAPSPLLSRPPFSSLQDVSEADFLSAHRSSLRRLLRCPAPEVTPSRCVQQKLVPDPTASDEAARHTQGFARAFLKRLEGLGFGLCEGPKNGNIRSFVFKKKKFSALGEEQRKILDTLKISEVEYNKCFTTKEQNGSVVCLE